MLSRFSPLSKRRIYRTIIETIISQCPFDSAVSNQAVQVGYTFTERHKHGVGFQLSLEKIRQEIDGNLRFYAVFFDNQHSVIVVVYQLLESFLGSVEGFVVSGKNESIVGYERLELFVRALKR